MRFQPLTFLTWSATVAIGMVLAGCSADRFWDQEFICQGQEQTDASFADPAVASASSKTYPLSVDFHLRGEQALVKTYSAHIDDVKAAPLRFGVKGPLAWLQGTFDKQSNELLLSEERQLDTPLGQQSVRSSGRFLCTAR